MTLAARLVSFTAAVGADIKRLTPSVSPVFTYTSGALTGVTYPDGSVKTLSYVSGQLTRIDHLRLGVTGRKDFHYAAGALSGITETTL